MSGADTPAIRLILGDCLDVLRTLEAGSVDAVVTDPPAGIGFMGKTWDKPGVMGFSGACAMPATMSAIRNTQDARVRERGLYVAFLSSVLAECLRVARPGSRLLCWAIPRTSHWTGTAIEDAGWLIEDRVTHVFGQGFPKAKSKLKPAAEDWWLARKPGGKVPELNIDVSRIGTNAGWSYPNGRGGKGCFGQPGLSRNLDVPMAATDGRWPANFILTCCGHDPHDDDCPVALLDAQSGHSASRVGKPRSSNLPGAGWGMTSTGAEHADAGGASRFFYCAKAPKSDRGDDNTHPTVKNTELMRWLCRLITPPGGMVLDPFTGSGSTGKAAVKEGFGFIGIERSAEYIAVAERRIAEARAVMPLFANINV